MARPPKYNENVQAEICKALRLGNTREASAGYVGIHRDTFNKWTKRYPAFFDAVAEAESVAQINLQNIIVKAAQGVDAVVTTTTTKTIFKTRTIHHDDGTVIEEPVALQDKTTTVVESREYDWRAALEILKRRFRHEWGDNITFAADRRVQAAFEALFPEETGGDASET